MLDRFRRRNATAPTDPPVPRRGPASAVDAAVKAFAADGRWLAEDEQRKVPEMAALLESPEEERADILMLLIKHRLAKTSQPGLWNAVSLMARRRIVLRPDQLLELLKAADVAVRGGAAYRDVSILDQTSQVIERSFKEQPDADLAEAREHLRTIVKRIDSDTRLMLQPTARKRFLAVLDDGSAATALDAITRDDAVGPALLVILDPATADRPAGPFIAHLTAATKSGKPSPAWLEQTRQLAEPCADGGALVRQLLQAALDADDSVATYDDTGQSSGGRVVEVQRFISTTNEAVLRNIVWAAAALRETASLGILRDLTKKCITVIGGAYGNPRSLAIALACPAAIGAMDVPGSLGTLQALQRGVRHGSVLREINKAIDALAAASNVSRAELLETAVEDHGLDRQGRRVLQVGEWAATVAVEPSGIVTTTWRDPAGTDRASLPKAVKDAHPDAAKAVTALVKEIRATVATERDRLDRVFIDDRRWPVETWRERYLDHPITGALSRALLWRFSTEDADVVGLPDRDGNAVTTEDGSTLSVPADAEVRLWHPVEASDASVLAWRSFLLEGRRAQVTKQVFRETYTVTPAELETATYSNRFARHVIRQVQARSLMKGRGWSPVALAWWDDGVDHGVARRKLEAHGLRVEFFYDPITDIQPTTSELYPYCTTDQVRFFDLVTDRGVRVADVPRVAFSEVMRDVDLFVGVTSIGADANWLDQGERRFDTYWNTWGFGALSEPAKIRRDVISTILPGLRIADRCTLGDRFLEVRGDKRQYKIHLGSSNILMSPSDRYLCIVATRHPADDRLFLPFDDDPTLSLILSKAFLLAEDSKITDRTILQQIEGD